MFRFMKQKTYLSYFGYLNFVEHCNIYLTCFEINSIYIYKKRVDKWDGCLVENCWRQCGNFACSFFLIFCYR